MRSWTLASRSARACGAQIAKRAGQFTTKHRERCGRVGSHVYSFSSPFPPAQLARVECPSAENARHWGGYRWHVLGIAVLWRCGDAAECDHLPTLRISTEKRGTAIPRVRPVTARGRAHLLLRSLSASPHPSAPAPLLLPPCADRPGPSAKSIYTIPTGRCVPHGAASYAERAPRPPAGVSAANGTHWPGRMRGLHGGHALHTEATCSSSSSGCCPAGFTIFLLAMLVLW